MFGSRKAAEQRLAEVVAAFDQLEQANKTLIAEADKMRQRAFLIDIQREGKFNKFMFARNGQIHVIETYGTLGDDVNGWRRALIEESKP